MIDAIVDRQLIIKLLKWLIVVLSVVFLVFKFIQFQDYNVIWLRFAQLSVIQVGCLFIVLLLVPVNIGLEAVKWRLLIRKTEVLSFSQSLRAVLAGFTTGFVTPNRIGEMAGRMTVSMAANRGKIAIYSLINSLSQNFIIALAGVPAFVAFVLVYQSYNFEVYLKYLIVVGLFLVVMTGLIFLIPTIAGLNVFKKRWSGFGDLSKIKQVDLLEVTLLSLLRFFVFCFQFYLLLLFFDVNLAVVNALITIPSMYLLVTFTPAFAVSEVIIRSSYAVFFVGFFSGNTPGIVASGLFIWVVNFAIPMMIGAKLLLEKNN